MKPFAERLERIETEELIHIPTMDGSGIAETVKVTVPALRDPKDGEIYLTTEATAILDKVKARRMGLLMPEQLKALRERLGLTQKQISELLQIGEKSWTRWETGKERPSRSMNVTLWALNDGRIDPAYLRALARRQADWATTLSELPQANPWLGKVQEIWSGWDIDHHLPQKEFMHAFHLFVSKAFADVAQSEFGFPKQTTAIWCSHHSSALTVQSMQPTKVAPILPFPKRGMKPADACSENSSEITVVAA